MISRGGKEEWAELQRQRGEYNKDKGAGEERERGKDKRESRNTNEMQR